MKAKKMIALFISTVLTIGTLAGCSSSGNGSSDGKSASSGSGKIELEFFTQKREAADTFDKIISEFNASQEEIVVKQNIVPE